MFKGCESCSHQVNANIWSTDKLTQKTEYKSILIGDETSDVCVFHEYFLQPNDHILHKVLLFTLYDSENKLVIQQFDAMTGQMEKTYESIYILASEKLKALRMSPDSQVLAITVAGGNTNNSYVGYFERTMLLNANKERF